MKKPETRRSLGGPKCVGKLEIVSANPARPVPTDKFFHDFDPAGLIPAAQTVRAPRYRIIPTETDLNVLPIPDKVLPITPAQSRTFEDLPARENRTVRSHISRKGEALAVSGLVDYGDEIDVIAPVDILKQIFKIPYSKAQISIAVRHIGSTLVLSVGPDFEDGEKLVRRHNKTAKCADDSLFFNFAMHSVSMEACDCPPNHHHPAQSERPVSHVPDQFDSILDEPLEASEVGKHVPKDEGFNHRQQDSRAMKGEVFPLKKNSKRNKAHKAVNVNEVSQVKENSWSSMQESEKYTRENTDGFLRALFWQFHNFRMLLGSDLLILSNERYVAVSLHLWDVSLQVTPLTWLEAWLDNVMASVPELAICYHQDGVVQGYELMKAEDIFLLKCVAEDGTPAFLPHVIQQNALMVLRFLQYNCKQDPGVYWLYKSAGEDVIQLFDLSVMPTTCHGDDSNDAQSVLPSPIYNGRSDILLSLGTLLYRIAHRLSLSMSLDKKARCARFLRQCLDFLDEPDHLVVRALAHEQFARLLLHSDKEMELTSDALPMDSKDLYGFKEDSSEVSAAKCRPTQEGVICSKSPEVEPMKNDSISSKLDAVHHVSQAIKSLSSKRHFQRVEAEIDHMSKDADVVPSSVYLSLCACGDADCLEVSNISQWLSTSKLDDKSWKLVLLLGESYLALGQAYKDNGKLYQAFRVVELACLVYGSMPQLENKTFISSISYNSSKQPEISGRSDKTRSLAGYDCLASEQLSTNSLFWARAWTLVGDLYVEFHLTKGKYKSLVSEKSSSSFPNQLKMSSEVGNEVERLKKKLGQFSQDCSSCSLVNCSCQSDRGNSRSSGSSSSGSVLTAHGRKHSKKLSSKGKSEADVAECKGDNVTTGGIFKYIKNSEILSIKKKKNPEMGDGEVNLTIALDCYDEAKKALGHNSVYSGVYKYVARKKGWVCNEIGRSRLKRRQLDEAGTAFVDAIVSFKEACDCTNIILIYCNLGHGRRAAAEEIASNVEALKKHAIFHDAYTNALENAKTEYCESLRYYRAAKMELNSKSDDSDSDSVSSSLRDELYTQYAHTYLRLGMLLAGDDSIAEVYGGNVVLEDITSPGAKKEGTKHEISANEAIREALSVYESLGDSRKQEAAYAHFQLACYKRDCCLKLLDSDMRMDDVTKRMKQYAALADTNWHKSMDFYGPNTHPVMYLTILMERSDLSFKTSASLHFRTQLETALTMLLGGRHLSEIESFSRNNSEVCARFWGQLQMLLKKMLLLTLPTQAQNSDVSGQQTQASKLVDVAKLKELYKMSLKSTDFRQLHFMYTLWVS